jgi:Bacterial protein of unknown function (HtrL_YibB)
MPPRPRSDAAPAHGRDVGVSPTTVVTCLFDLAPIESPSAAPAPNRLQSDEFLLGLGADLVCFTEPSLRPAVCSAREQHGLIERTEALPCAIRSLGTYELLGRATENRYRHPLLNGNPLRDTPLAALAGWCKLELLQRAIELDRFGAEHFIWIDFDLARSARTEHCREDRVFARTPDRVRVLQTRALNPSVVRDRSYHLSYRHGHFDPGLISGHRDRLEQFARAGQAELESALSDGFAPLEEHLIDLTVAAQPALFSCHHGDREHILENYRRPRGGAENLLSQLRTQRIGDELKPAAKLAARIVRAVRAGTFESDPALLAQLLEECFLVSYYAHQPDQTEARKVAVLYMQRAREDPDFREEFLRNEVRVRTNFSYLHDPP